jgi:ElaB/YqjD/DUF883 family membrane-anchored ribosome-binding protein
MKTDSRAIRNAVNESVDMDRWQAGAESYKDKMLSELKTIVGDAERLLKHAADSSSEGYATVRTQFDRQMDRTRDQLDNARTAVSRNARRSTAAARGYVRENPLRSVGLATAAGLIVGLLVVSFLNNRR